MDKIAEAMSQHWPLAVTGHAALDSFISIFAVCVFEHVDPDSRQQFERIGQQKCARP